MSKGRLVVSYHDGTWTDNLSIAHYGVRVGAEGLTLRIEVEPRERVGKVRRARQALAEFLAKRNAIHTIQIGKPRIASDLRRGVSVQQRPRLDVRLCAGEVDVLYPATVVFGPDEVVLNLG